MESAVIVLFCFSVKIVLRDEKPLVANRERQTKKNQVEKFVFALD